MLGPIARGLEDYLMTSIERQHLLRIIMTSRSLAFEAGRGAAEELTSLMEVAREACSLLPCSAAKTTPHDVRDDFQRSSSTEAMLQ